jgi:hypothetical protein
VRKRKYFLHRIALGFEGNSFHRQALAPSRSRMACALDSAPIEVAGVKPPLNAKLLEVPSRGE